MHQSGSREPDWAAADWAAAGLECEARPWAARPMLSLHCLGKTLRRVERGENCFKSVQQSVKGKRLIARVHKLGVKQENGPAQDHL